MLLRIATGFLEKLELGIGGQGSGIRGQGSGVRGQGA